MTGKEILFEKIKNTGIFWSYDVSSADDISDTLLIEHVLIYSDVDEIKELFKIYDRKAIKDVWDHRIVPDLRYRRLNVYLGRIFFDIEDIGAYLHEKATAHSRYEKLKRLDASDKIGSC